MRVHCRVLASFWQKATGLMFSSKAAEPLLFVFAFPARHAIHSLFCPPFDAVYLDQSSRVVDRLRVRKTLFWIIPKRNYKYLIEAPPGFAKRLKEGQRVKVNANDGWLEFDS